MKKKQISLAAVALVSAIYGMTETAAVNELSAAAEVAYADMHEVKTPNF